MALILSKNKGINLNGPILLNSLTITNFLIYKMSPSQIGILNQFCPFLGIKPIGIWSIYSSIKYSLSISAGIIVVVFFISNKLL